MSNFNYCPLTWHFCGEKNTKKIEKIQERALWFIYRDYDSSYESLLLKSQLPSLKVRRLRAIALEAFKILNNLSPVYSNDLLTFKNLSYSFRYTEGVDRGGGGTGIEGAESGVEGAESGVEGAGSGSRGGGKRGICGRGSGNIGGRNCFFY